MDFKLSNEYFVLPGRSTGSSGSITGGVSIKVGSLLSIIMTSGATRGTGGAAMAGAGASETGSSQNQIGYHQVHLHHCVEEEDSNPVQEVEGVHLHQIIYLC